MTSSETLHFIPSGETVLPNKAMLPDFGCTQIFREDYSARTVLKEEWMVRKRYGRNTGFHRP